MGKALPADYLGALPPHMQAINFNHALENYPTDRRQHGLLIRMYATEEDTYARAVLGGQYAAIPNTELLQTLLDVATQQAPPDFHLAKGSWVSPDGMNVRTVWKNVEIGDPDDRGGYGLGVFIGNDEIGQRKFRLWPMVKRTSCDNSIVRASGAGLELVHMGSAASKMTLITAAILESFRASADLLDRMMKAKAASLPNFNDVLGALADDYGWSESVTTMVAQGSENRHSLFGLVNGITYAAHTGKWSDAEDQTDLEMVAGELLYTNNERLIQRGDTWAHANQRRANRPQGRGRYGRQ